MARHQQLPVYLSLDEAAEVMSLSTRTIRRRISDGTIPAYQVWPASDPHPPGRARSRAAPYSSGQVVTSFIQPETAHAPASSERQHPGWISSHSRL